MQSEPQVRCIGIVVLHVMSEEIIRRLKNIERKVDAAKSAASDKGHTFIIIALLILLMRGCQ